MKSLVEYINDSMLKHIAIELKDYDIIYEKYGEYNGCNELALHLLAYSWSFSQIFHSYTLGICME